MSAKIVCPKCGRVLGDTNHSIDCRLNCKGCKKVVEVKMKVCGFNDYLRSKNDESK